MKKELEAKLKAAEGLLALHPESVRLDERVKCLEGVLEMLPKRKRFVKPTIEEVIDYFEEKESPEPIANAHAFCDYYDSINWYVGKKKMHNWKSAVSGWIRRNKEGRPNTPGNYVQDTTNLSNDEAHMKRMREMTGHG